jgi:hypothetical protein
MEENKELTPSPAIGAANTAEGPTAVTLAEELAAVELDNAAIAAEEKESEEKVPDPVKPATDGSTTVVGSNYKL